MRRALPLLILVTLGCEGERAGTTQALKEGLAAAEAAARLAPVDRSVFADARTLERVLRRDFAAGVRSLGARTLRLEATFVVDATGVEQSRREEELVLRLDGTGAYDLTHRLTASSADGEPIEDGRACRRVGGRFFTWRRHGEGSEVPVLDDEDDACLRSATEPMVGLLRLLLPHLRFEPLARGVSARLQLGEVKAEPRAVPPTATIEPGPRAPLVATHAVPSAASGTLELEPASGLVVAGSLTSTLAVRKAGHDATLTAQVQLSAGPLEGTITPPEGARRYDPRPRTFADRKALLGDDPKAAPQPEALPAPGDAPPLKVLPDEVPAGDTEDRPADGEAWDAEDAPP